MGKVGEERNDLLLVAVASLKENQLLISAESVWLLVIIFPVLM